jgi:hypothetical protein
LGPKGHVGRCDDSAFLNETYAKAALVIL